MVETNGDDGARSVSETLPTEGSYDASDIDYHTPHTSNDIQSVHDTDAPSLADGRSSKATDFYPTEDGPQKAMERLRRWNDGEGESSRREDTRWAQIRRDVEIVTTTLSLPHSVERGAIDYLRVAHEECDDGLRSVGWGRIESVVCGAIKVAAASEQIVLTEDDFEPFCDGWRVAYDAIRDAKRDLADVSEPVQTT